MIRRPSLVFIVMAIMLGSSASAQTPVIDESVEPTPTQVVIPTVEPTAIPIDEEEPDPTEAPQVTPTQVPPTIAPPSTPVPTETPSPSEPTVAPVEADTLEISGQSVVTLVPGSFIDLTATYRLGSDRTETGITATLIDPAGASLDGWRIATIDRLEVLPVDPSIPDDPINVEVIVTDQISQNDAVQLKWRITAPNHAETAQTVRIDIDSTIDGVPSLDLEKVYSVTVAASVHHPTLDCVSSADTAWDCSFDTDHPGAVNVTITGVAPTGWEMTLDDSPLTDSAALITDVNGAGSFVLAATYPIGCPIPGDVSAITMSVALNYPSGDVSTLVTDLQLDTERPEGSLTVSSFSFDAINAMSDRSAEGYLTVSYLDSPCAWQATIVFSDLVTNGYVVQDARFAVIGIDGLDDANITNVDGSIVISVPERNAEIADREFTVRLRIDLPHVLPPGEYVINVITQFMWVDAQ